VARYRYRNLSAGFPASYAAEYSWQK
jgi:hypothetical protein